jgi:hypothetical protein
MAKNSIGKSRVRVQHSNGPSELMRKIAGWILRVTIAACGVLAYFTNIHPIIEAKYGSPVAWVIFGVISTLLLVSLFLYACSFLFRR